MPPFLRVNRRLGPVLVTTSGKKFVGAWSQLLASRLGERDLEEPADQGEGVYRGVLGAVQVVPIEGTEAAKPENLWRLPGERSQHPN